MRQERWFRLLAVALLATLAFTACGGDDDGGDEEAAEPVPTEEYVEGLCSSMVDWQTEAGSLSQDLQEAVTADPDMSLDERKERITTYLEDLEASTQEMISSVEEAGVPDVEDGEQIADTLLSGFRELIGVIEDGQERVSALDTGDQETFRTETDEIGNDLQGGFSSVADGFREIGETPIDAAIEENETCQQIQT